MKSVRIIPLLVLMCLTVVPITVGAQTGPTEQIQEAVDTILAYLNDDTMDPEVRNKKIEELVKNRFDFPIMSQWILGIHWRKATPEQRQQFIDLYTQLLETTYKGRIGEYADQYTDERIDYVNEQVKQDRAMVDTLVITKNMQVPISYKLIQKGDQWMVYDVVIEEVSLVRNYRSTYDEILRKEGFDGLFSRMREKIAELKSSPPSAQTKEDGSPQ